MSRDPVAFGCPYEGDVSALVVRDLTKRLLTIGVYEVGISDTIGTAHPGNIERVLDAVLANVASTQVALHSEDLLYALHGLGIETGVSLERVSAATRFIADKVGRHRPLEKSAS